MIKFHHKPFFNQIPIMQHPNTPDLKHYLIDNLA